MRQQCILLLTLQVSSFSLHQKDSPGSSALTFCLPQQFLAPVQSWDLRKITTSQSSYKALFKGPLPFSPSAFTCFHIAQSLHDIARVSLLKAPNERSPALPLQHGPCSAVSSLGLTDSCSCRNDACVPIPYRPIRSRVLTYQLLPGKCFTKTLLKTTCYPLIAGSNLHALW